MPIYKVNPALAVEVAFRKELMGYKGLEVGNTIMTSAELQRMAGDLVFPLYPFDIVKYSQTKMDSSTRRQ